MVGASLLERVTGKSLSKKAHLGIFVVAFFLCSCLLAWIDEHDRGDTLQLSLNGVNLALSAQKSECDSHINGIQQALAVKEGISQTLQAQNGDQQDALNNCLVSLGKASQASPPQLTVLTAPATPDPKRGKYSRQILVLFDKTVSRTRGYLTCNKAVNEAFAWVMGAGMVQGSASFTKGSNVVTFDITSPTTSPIAPLMFTLFYDDVALESCQVNLQSTR